MGDVSQVTDSGQILWHFVEDRYRLGPDRIGLGEFATGPQPHQTLHHTSGVIDEQFDPRLPSAIVGDQIACARSARSRERVRWFLRER